MGKSFRESPTTALKLGSGVGNKVWSGSLNLNNILGLVWKMCYLSSILTFSGRINLVELQQILNVDFSHIETKVNEIVKHDHKLDFILGQLIDK